MTHVLQPGSHLGRAVKKCPTCRCRRRCVVRVYEYYSPTCICGGCGCVFSGGGGYGSKSERERTRRWVAEQWPNVPSVREAVREMVKKLKQGE